MATLFYGVCMGKIPDELLSQAKKKKYEVMDFGFKKAICCFAVASSDQMTPVELPSNYTISHFDNWLIANNVEEIAGYWLA